MQGTAAGLGGGGGGGHSFAHFTWMQKILTHSVFLMCLHMRYAVVF